MSVKISTATAVETATGPNEQMEKDALSLAESLKQYELFLKDAKKSINTLQLQTQHLSLLTNMLTLVTKLNRNEFFILCFRTNQCYNALVLTALRYLIRASPKYKIRKRAFTICSHLIKFTHKPLNSIVDTFPILNNNNHNYNSFTPAWTHDLYEHFFRHITMELLAMLADEVSYKEDATFINVMFDMVTYALQSARFTSLVSLNVVTGAFKLFMQHMHTHASQCHDLVSLCVERMSQPNFASNEYIIIFDYEKYALMMRQVKTVFVFLFDHYRLAMDVKRKSAMLCDLIKMCSAFRTFFLTAHIHQNRLRKELPVIFFELYDAFVAKSVVCDLMDNFELNASLRADYESAMESFSRGMPSGELFDNREHSLIELLIKFLHKADIKGDGEIKTQMSSFAFSRLSSLITVGRITFGDFYEMYWSLIETIWHKSMLENTNNTSETLIERFGECFERDSSQNLIVYFRDTIHKFLDFVAKKVQSQPCVEIKHVLSRTSTVLFSLAEVYNNLKSFERFQLDYVPILLKFVSICENLQPASVAQWIQLSFCFFDFLDNIFEYKLNSNNYFLNDARDTWTEVAKRVLAKIAQMNSCQGMTGTELGESMCYFLVDSLLWYIDYKVDREVKVELVELLGRCESGTHSTLVRFDLIQKISKNL